MAVAPVPAAMTVRTSVPLSPSVLIRPAIARAVTAATPAVIATLAALGLVASAVPVIPPCAAMTPCIASRRTLSRSLSFIVSVASDHDRASFPVAPVLVEVLDDVSTQLFHLRVCRFAACPDLGFDLVPLLRRFVPVLRCLVSQLRQVVAGRHVLTTHPPTLLRSPLRSLLLPRSTSVVVPLSFSGFSHSLARLQYSLAGPVAGRGSHPRYLDANPCAFYDLGGNGGHEAKELAPLLRCRWRRFFWTTPWFPCTAVLPPPLPPCAPAA